MPPHKCGAWFKCMEYSADEGSRRLRHPIRQGVAGKTSINCTAIVPSGAWLISLSYRTCASIWQYVCLAAGTA